MESYQAESPRADVSATATRPSEDLAASYISEGAPVSGKLPSATVSVSVVWHVFILERDACSSCMAVELQSFT